MNRLYGNELLENIQNELYCKQALAKFEVNEFSVYKALVSCIKDRLAYSWRESKSRLFSKTQIYVFSFEYNTGKFLNKYLKYLGMEKEACLALKDLGYDLNEILKLETLPLLGEGALGEFSAYILESPEQYNIKAYGLRYENGRFKQEIVNNQQVEKIRSWTIDDFNWEFKRDSKDLKICGKKVKSVSYDIPIMSIGTNNVNTLRLFQSVGESMSYPIRIMEGQGIEDAKNYVLVNSLSRFLYLEDANPLGKKIRLAQEYFLALSGVLDMAKDFENMGIDIKDDEFHVLLNENHTIMTIPVFMKVFCERFNISKKEALDMVWENFHYTTFECIEGNVKVWSKALVKDICPELVEYLDYIYNYFNLDNGGDYYNFNEFIRKAIKNMSPLSKMQKSCMKRQIKDQKDLKSLDYKVEKNILNISPWLWEANEKLYNHLCEKLGVKLLKSPEKLSDITSNMDEESLFEIQRIKNENKTEIAKKVYRDYGVLLNDKSMYAMSLSTFQEKRRQFLNCLYLTEKYFELIENSNVDMPDLTYFMGGMAAPKYLASKYVINYINVLKDMVNKDRNIMDKLKIVFVKDLNRQKVMGLCKGCDLVEEISTPGLEVVGDNVLKYMLNGSLVLGSKTGLNVELVDKTTGVFLFGREKDEVVSLFNKAYDVEKHIYEESRLGNLVNKIRRSSFHELKDSFELLYGLILKYNDSFQVFRDYDDYYNTWEEILSGYRNNKCWTRKSMKNIGACGEFSKAFTID